MAEFMEVAREKKRMCNVYHKCDCCGCPLNEGDANCGVFSVRYAEDDDIKRVEETVMTWAKEHSKPVYPSWYEWLNQIGVLGTAAIGAGYVSDRLVRYTIVQHTPTNRGL